MSTRTLGRGTYGGNLGSKLYGRGGNVSLHLSFMPYGKATEGMSGSEPDPGNPAVWDRRGAYGNVMSWSDDYLPLSRKRRIHRKSLA